MERSGHELLFVYGTLRRGFAAHALLRRLGARLKGNGAVPGILYDLGTYPGARPAEGCGLIAGEVYAVPNAPASLAAIDRYEGYRESQPQASEFVRARVRVALQDATAVEAWIYWLNRTGQSMKRIPGGDYAAGLAMGG